MPCRRVLARPWFDLRHYFEEADGACFGPHLSSSLLTTLQHKNHPNGNSSFTFAFASLVTHSLFRTDYKDWSINNTSSYLDLSPLYGYSQSFATFLIQNMTELNPLVSDQTTQDKVRDKAAGRGKLYPDTFSEERLLFLPPAASVVRPSLVVHLCSCQLNYHPSFSFWLYFPATTTLVEKL